MLKVAHGADDSAVYCKRVAHLHQGVVHNDGSGGHDEGIVHELQNTQMRQTDITPSPDDDAQAVLCFHREAVFPTAIRQCSQTEHLQHRQIVVSATFL